MGEPLFFRHIPTPQDRINAQRYNRTWIVRKNKKLRNLPTRRPPIGPV